MDDLIPYVPVDLNLTGMQVKEICKQSLNVSGHELDMEQAKRLQEVSHGNPLFVNSYLEAMQLYEEEEKLFGYAYRRMFACYDSLLFYRCTPIERKFLLYTSYAESFDSGAEVLLGEEGTGIMESLYRKDSALFVDCIEEPGKVHYPSLFLKYLKYKRGILLSEEEIHTVHCKLADYEKEHKAYRKAADYYGKAGEYRELNRMLAMVAAGDPSMVLHSDLLERYTDTWDTFLEFYPEILCAKAALAAQSFRKDEAEKYLQKLRDSNHNAAPKYLTFLEQVLPYRSIKEPMTLPMVFQNQWVPFPDVTVKEYMPTLLFGTKDLTVIEEIPSSLEQIYGTGTYELLKELLHCEKSYERAESTENHELLQTVSSLSMKAYAQRSTLVYIMAEGLLYRMQLLKGRTQAAKNHLYAMKQEALKEQGNTEVPLLRNVEALLCIYGLYTTKGKMIDDYSEHYHVPFLFKERLSLLTQIRCMIYRRRYEEAYSAIARCKEIFESYNRTYEVIKLTYYEALLRYRTKEKWKEYLYTAIGKTKEAGLLRILAEEGEPLLTMIAEIKDTNRFKEIDPDYMLTLVTEARRIALLYPDYMKPAQQPEAHLTTREQQVLALSATDLTASEIAEKMQISQSCYKFHTQGLYKKLNAHNRNEAVSHARSLGLLDD